MSTAPYALSIAQAQRPAIEGSVIHGRMINARVPQFIHWDDGLLTGTQRAEHA